MKIFAIQELQWLVRPSLVRGTTHNIASLSLPPLKDGNPDWARWPLWGIEYYAGYLAHQIWLKYRGIMPRTWDVQRMQLMLLRFYYKSKMMTGRGSYGDLELGRYLLEQQIKQMNNQTFLMFMYFWSAVLQITLVFGYLEWKEPRTWYLKANGPWILIQNGTELWYGIAFFHRSERVWWVAPSMIVPTNCYEQIRNKIPAKVAEKIYSAKPDELFMDALPKETFSGYDSFVIMDSQAVWWPAWYGWDAMFLERVHATYLGIGTRVNNVWWQVQIHPKFPEPWDYPIGIVPDREKHAGWVSIFKDALDGEIDPKRIPDDDPDVRPSPPRKQEDCWNEGFCTPERPFGIYRAFG